MYLNLDLIVSKECVIQGMLIIMTLMTMPMDQSYDLDVDITLRVCFDLEMFLRTRLVGERFSPLYTFSLPISSPCGGDLVDNDDF